MYDQSHFVVAQQRLDGADDPDQSADHDPLADLERLLAAEVTGRRELVAATRLIAIGEGGDSREVVARASSSRRA